MFPSIYVVFILSVCIVCMLPLSLKYGLFLPSIQSQIISYWGYPSEAYDVVTEDGFILGVYRIPYGKGENSERTGKRPIFYLQHGMFVSASSWVANPPYTSLAFTLADSGYDVWMGNSRGSVWSQKHVHYSPESPEFWAFSFDEMAKYDLVATLNFIMKKTNQEKLYYVGHSQGTTIAFAAFSTNPKLAQRIEFFFALAPMVSVQHSRGPLKTLMSIPPSLLKVRIFAPKYLHPLKSTSFPNSFFLSQSRLDVYLSQNPAGTSVQNIVHWNQVRIQKSFLAPRSGGNWFFFPFNCTQVTPPLYDLEAIKIPTAIWSGEQDRIAPPREVDNLLPKLPNLIYHKKIPYYNHIDFLLGLDTPQEFFHEILYLIKMYMKHYRPCRFLVSAWEAGRLQGWEKGETWCSSWEGTFPFLFSAPCWGSGKENKHLLTPTMHRGLY
uniref:AB hydrolase-1 domain-containing protein n=1 Tax=Vombatus ursinus TaxID=29139 RepID=A0A4X2M2M8_VOMUR